MPIVHRINVSDGGVPKTSVDNAIIDDRGVVGDRQEDTVHHGSPDQALCLYSLEVIEGLQDEGHPIAEGSAGENLTIAGIDWSLVVPGVRLEVGSQVEIEIAGYATPCSKNAQWFVDGDFTRMLQSRHPGESRIYARILTGGAVTMGDEVRLVGKLGD